MKFEYLKIAMAGALVLGASSSNAQVLSYGIAKQSERGDYVQEGHRSGRDGDLIIDSDLSNLPSDMTLRKWYGSNKPFFASMDVDQDGVLSEFDLRSFPEEELFGWSENTLESMMTFWLPDLEEHKSKISRDIEIALQEDAFLKQIDDAVENSLGVYKDLGLEGNSGRFFVSAIASGDAQLTRVGSFGDTFRSWAEVSMPFELKVRSQGDDLSHNLVAKILVIRKFPKFPGDDLFALWGLTVAAAE